MYSTSHLVLTLINFDGDLDTLVRGAKPAQTARKTLESTTCFENSFASTTRSAQYLKDGSAYRYDKTSRLSKEARKCNDQNKLLARYRELNFLSFCFLVPRLSANIVASISDEAWSAIVRWLSGHIWKQFWNFKRWETDDDTLYKFMPKAKEKLTAFDQDLAKCFENEWKKECPVWKMWRDQLQKETATLDSGVKKHINEIATQPLPLTDRLTKLKVLEQVYTNNFVLLTTRRVAEICLHDVQGNRYQAEVKKTNVKLTAELRSNLKAAAQHDKGPYERVLAITQLISDFELRLEQEMAKHLIQACALGS